MRSLLLAIALLIAAPFASAESRVVLVTIDGLRWQEVFGGADPSLVTDPEDKARYVDAPDRAAALMPFLQSFRQRGALFGNVAAGECAKVENRYWFSYPGYAEMLGGRPNPQIRFNAKEINNDVTVLEWLNGQHGFEKSVRVYAEWDVVPFILNQPRSGLPIFVADAAQKDHDSQVIAAARNILEDGPRVTWIDLGDTDNRAHEGDYHGYLAAAAAADAFLSELWTKLESDPRYAGQTTLIVTADHGRGGSADDQWRGHGSGRYRFIIVPGLRRAGSNHVFMGAIGPGIRPGAGDVYKGATCAATGQVAATMLKSLGVDPAAYKADARPPLDIFR